MNINEDSNIFKLDLQRFAEGEGEGDTTPPDDPNTGSGQGEGDKGDGQNGEGEEKKTFTQEELDQIVKERLAREKTKLDTEKKKLEEEIRLSKLSADERKEAEEKAKDDELAKLKEELSYRDLVEDTLEVLATENIPTGFKDFLIQKDAETTNKNIKAFKETWDKAVQDAVLEKLKGKTPGIGGNSGADKKIEKGSYGANLAKGSKGSKKENPFF